MNDLLEVKNGLLTLTNILSTVWLGDWDQYEKVLSELPDELKKQLPFHSYYKREEVDLWYQNHFDIPGDHFVSPYFSTYSAQEKGNSEETNKELLCLIGTYEKVGFYYPLEKKLYPDHIASLSVFLGSIIREEIQAEKNEDQESLKPLQQMRIEVVEQYLTPLLNGLKNAAETKVHHAFLKEFIAFYSEFIAKEVLY
ncbi:molecular chaperone TorD family protein [Bacillota bacterium Lsc_1132]